MTRRCVWVAAALLVGACAAPPAPPAPGVVAQVDSLRVHAADLRAFAARAPLAGDTPEARRQSCLRGLLATHLLEGEGRARGLDTTSAVRRKVDSRWRGRILERYRRQAVWSQVTVPESMAQAFFDSLGLGRQRQAWGILTATQADARNALSLLRLGRNFEEVAAQRSVHRLSAAQGGVLGYVSQAQARSLGIPDSLFEGLADGELSPVLPQGELFQVIRFQGSRTAELAQHRANIESLLRERLEVQREAEHVEALVARLQWRLVPGALALLRARVGVDGTLRTWQLGPGEADEALFTYAGGLVTLGEYLEALWEAPTRAGSGWGVGDSAAVAAAARETVRTERLFLADALRMGLDRDLEDDRDNQLRRQMLIELRRQVLQERAGATTPQEARRYFEAHPELFRQADDIVVVEALVATRAEAEQILAEVEAGASFLELAGARTRRTESLWESPGTLRLGEHERVAMAGLYQAAQRAEVGVLTGPVEVHDGVSVFQVVGRQAGALPPFETVERRATALARTERDTAAFEGFVDDLLAAHQDRITVYPEALEAALPDTLLLRLAGSSPGAMPPAEEER